MLFDVKYWQESCSKSLLQERRNSSQDLGNILLQ